MIAVFTALADQAICTDARLRWVKHGCESFEYGSDVPKPFHGFLIKPENCDAADKASGYDRN